MEETEARRLLHSRSPSERIEAAQWLSEHASRSWRNQLVEAMEIETVPQIRRHLDVALHRLDSMGSNASDRHDQQLIRHSDGRLTEEQDLLSDLAGLIRHETEPAIGWLRKAANREIALFEASATNRTIEALRRRIDGVAQLADASREPEWTSISISELVNESIPPLASDDRLVVNAANQSTDDMIETDRGLMALIIGNSISNAIHASSTVDPVGIADVSVNYGVSKSEFWLTISNPFSGSSFTLQQVSGIGTSTKTGHRGLGVLAANRAASRMRYLYDLSAVGGIATASVRGSRFHV